MINKNNNYQNNNFNSNNNNKFKSNLTNDNDKKLTTSNVNKKQLVDFSLDQYSRSKFINDDALISLKVVFGGLTNFWNPKMQQYIYKKALFKSKIIQKYNTNKKKYFYMFQKDLIIDSLYEAFKFVYKQAYENNDILFIGSNFFLSEIIEDEVTKIKEHFINNRWIGGSMTNFKVIQYQIAKMKNIEKLEITNALNKYAKKEQLKIRKNYYKLKRLYGGIRNLKNLPKCIIVYDAFKNKTAIEEAKKLKIPIVSFSNTNTNPDGIDYLIPFNTNSKFASYLSVKIMIDAIKMGKLEESPEYAFSKINGDELKNQIRTTYSDYFQTFTNQENNRSNVTFKDSRKKTS